MNRSVLRLLLFLVTVTSLTACQLLKKPASKTKSTRRAPVNRYAIKERYGINTVDSIPGSKANEPSLPSAEQKTLLINNLSALWQREIPFETFNGKAKMRYESRTDKQEFVAHIRIQRDKAIWINVTAAMGAINVARVLITPDSIFFLNYLQREAQKMQIADAVKLLPVPADFKVLQNLIIGNVLNRSGSIVDVTDFGGTWTLEVADDVMTEQMGYNKSDSTIQSLQMRTKDNVLQGMINFGKYQLTNGRRFATDRTLNINNAGEPHNIDMNFNKAEFDQPVDFPFSIPPKFKLK